MKHKDALDTLGTLIDDTYSRDAIHLAVIPMKAIKTLYAGDAVQLIDGKAVPIWESPEDAIGVVDPFLKENVRPGQWFWLVLNPRTITSLHHVWTHPAFPDEVPADPDEKLREQILRTKKIIGGLTPKEEAVMWMKNYVDTLPMDYDTLRNAAKDYIANDTYFSMGPLLEGDWVSDEFWDYFEIIENIDVPGHKRNSFFTCAC